MKGGGRTWWLRLTDKSDLVLTTLTFYNIKTEECLARVTRSFHARQLPCSVKLAKKPRLVVLGTILLAFYVILMIGSIIAGPAWSRL